MTSDQKQTLKDSNAEQQELLCFCMEKEKDIWIMSLYSERRNSALKTLLVPSQLKISYFLHILGIPWTIAHRASLFMGFLGLEYWSEKPFLFSRGSSWPRNQVCVSCMQADSLLSETPGRCVCVCVCVYVYIYMYMYTYIYIHIHTVMQLFLMYLALAIK